MKARSAFVSVVAALAASAGCSYRFDENAPDVALVGEAPDLSGAPRFRARHDERLRIMRGRDGSLWVLAVRPVSAATPFAAWNPATRTAVINGFGPLWSVRLIAVDAPGSPEVASFQTNTLLAAGSTIWLAVGDELARSRLLVLSLPDVTNPRVHEAAYRQLAIDDTGDEYAIWGETSSTIEIYRPGIEPPIRSVPIAVDYFSATLALSPDGGWLAVSYTHRSWWPNEPDWRRLVRVADGFERYDLEWAGAAVSFSTEPSRIALCGATGLRRVDLPGGPTVTLDAQPCARILRLIPDRGRDSLVYLRANRTDAYDAALVVDLDGQGTASSPYRQPPDPPPDLAYVDVGSTGLLTAFFVTTPIGLYAGQPVVAYVNDWQFAERGAFPSFSRDTRRVRWLEHAGRVYPSGDLTSAAISDRSRILLANNARAYAEIADGRVLVADNQVELGLQNRVILVDEAAREAHWIAGSADSFEYTEGSDLVAVRLVGPNADVGDLDREVDVAIVPLDPPARNARR